MKKELETHDKSTNLKLENMNLILNSTLREKLNDFLSLQEFDSTYNLNLPTQTIESFDLLETMAQYNTKFIEDLKKFFNSNLGKIDNAKKESSVKGNIKIIIRKCFKREVLDNFTAVKSNTENSAVKRRVFKNTHLSKNLQCAVRNCYGAEFGDEKAYHKHLSSIFNVAIGWEGAKGKRCQGEHDSSSEQL